MDMKYYSGGSAKSMKKGGANELGMMSVKAGRDNNKGVTRTDIILAAQKNNAGYGMQSGKPALTSAMNGYQMKKGGSCGKVFGRGYFRRKK